MLYHPTLAVEVLPSRQLLVKHSCMPTTSCVQTPPTSREEKGSGVTSPNPWASSRSMERPIRSQNSVY